MRRVLIPLLAWFLLGAATDPLTIWSNQESPLGNRAFSSGNGCGDNNRALYYPFHVEQTITATRIVVYNGPTTSGNVDVGLYQTDGTRLVSAGSTAQSGASQLQTFDIADTELSPGSYYMAVACSSIVADFVHWIQPQTLGVNVTLAGSKQQASAFPLPASATFADHASTTTLFPVMAVLFN